MERKKKISDTNEQIRKFTAQNAADKKALEALKADKSKYLNDKDKFMAMETRIRNLASKMSTDEKTVKNARSMIEKFADDDKQYKADQAKKQKYEDGKKEEAFKAKYKKATADAAKFKKDYNDGVAAINQLKIDLAAAASNLKPAIQTKIDNKTKEGAKFRV